MNREQRREAQRKLKKDVKNEKVMTWDELLPMYRMCFEMLSVVTLIEQPLREVFPYVEDKDGLNNTVSSIAKDVNQLAEELTIIHKSHADMQGEPDLENIADLFNCLQAYMTWMDRANSVLVPQYNAVLDIHYLAQRAKAAADGQNPEDVQRLAELELPTFN